MICFESNLYRSCCRVILIPNLFRSNRSNQCSSIVWCNIRQWLHDAGILWSFLLSLKFHIFRCRVRKRMWVLLIKSIEKSITHSGQVIVETLLVLVRFLHQIPTAVSLVQQIYTNTAAQGIVSQSTCWMGRLSVHPHPLCLPLHRLSLRNPAQLAQQARQRLLALLFRFCQLDGMLMAVGLMVCQQVEPWSMNWTCPTTQSRIVLHIASRVAIQLQEWSTGTYWSIIF
jgi:hypothetical protein